MGLCNNKPVCKPDTKPVLQTYPVLRNVTLCNLNCKTLEELDEAIIADCAKNGYTFQGMVSYYVRYSRSCFNGCEHGDGWSECSYTHVAYNKEYVEKALSNFNEDLSVSITRCYFSVSTVYVS